MRTMLLEIQATVSFKKKRLADTRRYMRFEKYLILLKPMVGAQGIEPWTSPV